MRSRLGSVPAVLAAIVVAGLVLRVWISLAITPAGTNLSDSLVYVGMADNSLFADPIRQAGYSIFLRAAHVLSDQIELTIVIQHLLGIATALLLYAALRRAGAQVWAAAVAAAAVLLSVDQVFLEHSLMSETVFTFVLALSVYTATRALVAGAERRIGPLSERAWWLLATGIAVGLLPWIRLVGLPLVAVVALWVLVALPAAGIRRRVAGSALVAVPALALLLAYALDSPSGLAPSSGWGSYARSAQFAECSRFDPPAGTESLCEDTPPDGRNGPDFYFFEPGSPAVQLYGAPPNGDDELGTFGRRAIVAQPFDYAEAVARDFSRYFFRPTEGRRAFTGPAYEALEVDRDSGLVEDDVAAVLNEYYEPEEYTIRSSASTLAAVQHVLRFHPALMLIAVLLGAAGLFWERGPRRALIALLLACSIALLLTPTMATTYGARYAIPVGGLLAAAGALGLAAVVRVVRDRRQRRRTVDQ